MKNRWESGTHNVISDYSSFKFKRSEMRFTWDGWLVHEDEWEKRQPQLTIRGRDERIAVPDTRPRQPDKFFVPDANDL